MRIVILGASFGGLGAARELSRILPPTKAHVTVIDQANWFTFRPSLPWVVFGQRRPEDIQVPLVPLLTRWGIRFVQDRVEALEPERQRVVGRLGQYPYDFLIIALGGTSPPAPVPHLDGWGHRPLWLADAVALGRAVQALEAGSVVVTLCPNSPLHCPAYELIFHMDRLLRRRGVRPRCPLTVISYEEAPFAAGGPIASALIQRWLQEQDVSFRPSTFVQGAEPGYVLLPGGERVPAALVIYVPPLAGPPLVRGVPGLTDGDGFVLTDPWLRSIRYGNIFAVGDIVAWPGPKNGRSAEIQGKVAARNVAAALGHGAAAPYSSHFACLLDLGGGRGLATLRKPAPQQGRTRTLATWPGWLPHLAKVGMEQYYLRFQLQR